MTKRLENEPHFAIWREVFKGDSPERDVEVVLSLSARELVRESPALAARWQELTVFPSMFDAIGAVYVWNVWDKKLEEQPAVELLTQLHRRSLIQYDPKFKRYTLHDLIKPIAKSPFSYGIDDPLSKTTAARLSVAFERYIQYFNDTLKYNDPDFLDAVATKILEEVVARNPDIVTRKPSVAESDDDSEASGEPSESESEIEQIRNQAIVLQDFPTYLSHLQGLPDGPQKDRLEKEFGITVTNFLRRGVSAVNEYAIGKEIPEDSEMAKQWKGLENSPWFGELFWMIAQVAALQGKLERACADAERALPSLRTHSPDKVEQVEAQLVKWRAAVSKPQ